jgi:8-amino-7-oxononanoate synthase
MLALHDQHRLRSSEPLEGASRINVTSSGRPLVSFCSNDYLGLACHPALAEAAAEAAARSGFGASASRLVSGTMPEHLALEGAVASLVRSEAALLFPTGYHANLGAVTALAGPQDLIVADRLCHASIIDACRLSRAKLAFYPHLDLQRAEKHLRHWGPTARRRFLITESLFSMDGDVAPLLELHALARAYDTVLVVDEAHAVGCMGPSGRGLCAQFSVQPDVLIGTLGKALGASGAFVAGSAGLRSYLMNSARTFLFTTALPPPVAAAALAAVRIIISTEGDTLRHALHEASGRLRALLHLSSDPFSPPIIPLILGPDDHAVQAANKLLADGLLVRPIRPPAVPEGTARLRITISARHTRRQIDTLAEAIISLSIPSAQPSKHLPSRQSVPSAFAWPPSNHGVVLLGTDTSVGKSTIAAALLHLLSARGHPVVPFKPVETGATPSPADASMLLAASGRDDIPIQVVCPFPFPLPLAPAAAAAAAGITLSAQALLGAAAVARTFGSPLVVESAGGLLTPYGHQLTSADLAVALGFPVLLVARNALGTVNHSALAIGEIRRRSLPFLGIILVNTDASEAPDHPSNATLIAELTGVRALGLLPYINSPTPSRIAAVLQQAADLNPILDPLT